MNWNLERTWQVTIDDKTEKLSTVELSRFRCVVMPGAAGAGKTTEAERLASHESALGRRVRRCRLAEFADTSAELGEQLATLSAGASKDTVLYLDALDEAMIPARRRWLAIKHLIANKLHGTGTAIRITCRPAVWPRELSDVVGEFAGHESFATAFLHPLDDDDIGVAAVSLGIDPEAFLERLESTRARSLAGVPHPVSWTHVCATRHGVARIPRALRVACDTPAFRGASTGCSVRRTQRRPRARRRGFERPGRRRLAP